MTFRPGQSGNPAGTSPRGKIFTQALITALKRTDENDVEAIQRLADKLVNHALTTEPCDVYAIKEIADRVEGKSVQRMAGDDDEPITALRIIWQTGLNQFHDLSTAPWKSSDPSTSEANAEPPLSPTGEPEKP